MALEFHGNQISFFGQPLPRLTKASFFPDQYDLETGSIRPPNAPVAEISYTSNTAFIHQWVRFMSVQTLGGYASDGLPLDDYDVCREPNKTTIYLRHAGEVVGSYQENVLHVAPQHRGRGLSTILILAKMAVVGGRANPSRPMTREGAAAFLAAYNWLLQRNLID